MYIIKINFKKLYWVLDLSKENSWTNDKSEAHRFISYSMALDKSNILSKDTVVILDTNDI